MKKEETKQPVTRAEKRDGAKNLIRELLKKGGVKSNDLIDEAAKLYAERFAGEETENPNDVKGRIGSVLDVMKKDGEVLYENGICSLKEEKTAKKTTRTAKKKEETATVAEQPAPKKRTAKKKEEEPKTEERKSEEVKAEETKAEEKSAPKKRATRAKAKTKETVEEKPAVVEVKEEKTVVAEVKEEETPKEEKKELAPRPKAELSPKGTVMDMSFLFGAVKPKQDEPVKKEEIKKEEPKIEQPVAVKENPVTPKTVEKPLPKIEEKPLPKTEEKAQVKAEEKAPQKKEESPQAEPKKPVKEQPRKGVNVKPAKSLTADERLQEAFLARLRRLGGEYFEYYSVYLLEKYSRRNGRRLEGLTITAGDHDGGIDGEIVVSDRMGFKETIYIQAKNWDPDKGDERLWTVGETLLQQFIGACVCRQAKQGKQHCRGIFMTTSRFTPEAKRVLNDTADKFVGYDGSDIFEAAKECAFGLIKKNGEWALDENLLSGMKAFFNMN